MNNYLKSLEKSGSPTIDQYKKNNQNKNKNKNNQM